MAENYLNAQSAAKELGVSTATLYAYVSRGLVRSETAATKTRIRRYRAEDIAQLKARKLARNDPAKVAAQTLQWGAPILDSAISLIADLLPRLRRDRPGTDARCRGGRIAHLAGAVFAGRSAAVCQQRRGASAKAPGQNHVVWAKSARAIPDSFADGGG
jgi:MerR-like DNA binding protein